MLDVTWLQLQDLLVDFCLALHYNDDIGIIIKQLRHMLSPTCKCTQPKICFPIVFYLLYCDLLVK